MHRLVLVVLVMCAACSCPPKNGTSTSPPPPGPPPPASDRTPAVAQESPLYARVEGTRFKNECRSDADCHPGGCSGEVCTAEEGVNSTCEAAHWPQSAAAKCGCVASQCIWYYAAGAGPGGEAKQGEPCRDGKCAAGLSCVEYFGIAGPRGPKFTSCEIRCVDPGARCPDGQQCITIADGPGRVCRPPQ